MAKQRASLSLPRSSSSDSSQSSTSSTGSNINVSGTRKIRSASLASSASHNSTPPTSLPEDSISDVASEKQAMALQLTPAKAEDDAASRRSSRRKSGPASYNVGALAAAKRVSSVENLKAQEKRSFSGQTLVNDTEMTSADTPRRKLLDEGLKSLDMDWDVGALGGETSANAESSDKPKKRKSLSFDKISEAVGKVTRKVLGKRSRDETESTNDGARRQSRRISTLASTKTESHEDDDDEDIVERPSKMARVASTFSLPSLSSTFNLSKSQKTPASKPVKKYQKQGLYVGQNPQEYKSEAKKSKKQSLPTSGTEVRTAVMPLPMFDYLERERPFVIPYGVFAPQWRGRGEEKPKDWGKINKNRFVGDAKDEWVTVKLGSSACICKTECGEDCWNRAMGAECDNNSCKVGPDCSNRDFSQLSARMARANKHDKKSLAYLYNAGVEVIKTKDRGFGVRACRDFGPHEIITEYTGEIITQKEAYRRVKEEYTGKSDYYQMEFDQGMILDATRGSLARFVNHCCDPNCEMVKRTVSGQPRMALFAGENGIMAGEELTYDYNFDPYSTTNVQKCLCGASNCRQILGPKPAGEKKPATRKEQLEMATDLKRVATNGSKRKASELFDDESMAVEIPKELVKKRKVPQMSKGWAYIDPEMERQRQEEAEKDRLLKQLQRDGRLGTDIKVDRPKYPSRSAKMVEKIKTSLSTTGKPKTSNEHELKPVKQGMLSRVSGSLKRKPSTATTSMTTSEKRKSTLSTASSSLRQSTLSFQARSVSGTSGEALLGRTTSNTSAASSSKASTAAASKRNSVMSKMSSKRNSTVRVVEPEDE